MIELLAPAKNKTCAFAAIDFGADALYIGASDFGARKNAANSLEDIKQIVDYAHLFDVKVYVAVNTILDDMQIEKAQKLIEKLEKLNADAVIIQDMGLVEMKHEIPFHASTQCDIRNVEKVNFLKNAGFTRVVLARELSLKQIKEIKQQTDIELEIFVQGALCVSYSGQCYMSYAIGGRSANKGECAQPCRKKYSLIDDKGNIIAKDKYLLSLKDFNASKFLKDFDEIGITSLKIEGRLKDEDYVKNVVAYYRKKIDSLNLKKTSLGHIQFDFTPNLNKTFNRGFCEYFLEKRNKCFSFNSPKSMGEILGKIEKIEKDYFILSSDIALKPQDGLCFFENEKLKGCLVNKIQGRKIFPNKMEGLKKGIEVFRNQDSEFDKILKNSRTQRKIFANIDFDLNSIKITDETGLCCELSYEYEELALKKDLMISSINKSFKKTNDTIFSIQNINIKTSEMPFLSMSKLNELRRELLEKLKIARLQNYKPQRNIPQIKPSAIAPSLDYKANILNEKAKEFYEKCGCQIEENALESGISPERKTVMTTKYCLKYAFNMCSSKENLFLIDEKGKKYPLKFDCEKCEMEVIF